MMIGTTIVEKTQSTISIVKLWSGFEWYRVMIFSQANSFRIGLPTTLRRELAVKLSCAVNHYEFKLNKK